MNIIPLNHQIAALVLRLILGFIFLLQGFGKVYTWGVSNVYNMAFKQEGYAIFPDFLLQLTAYYTSYIELIGGLLLVIGFKKDWALYALASVLVIVTIGHGIAEPIWDLSHVMPRTILLVALLLLPSNWDRFSIDYYLHKNQSSF